MRMEEYRQYFDGDIFEAKVPLEHSSADDDPELYPVGLNLTKMLCLSQADAMFGAYGESPVTWGMIGDEEGEDSDKEAISLLNRIVTWSNPHTFWEVDLDRQIYGGGVFQVRPPLKKGKPVRWYRVPTHRFFAVYDPDDPDYIWEAFVVTRISREQANHRFGVQVDEDFTMRVERWTPFEYSNTVGGKRVDKFSGKNPYGIVPFVYIPRYRANNWYGDALTMEVMGSQNELNMRVADIGEAINYNAHPVRWGRDLPSGFDADTYPIDPNAMWDLGRTVGDTKPEVGVLEASSAIGEGAFKYVEFLYDWSRTSVFSPPIAFGEDDGGGQRSGVTLEIRMWPLIKAMQRSRSYFFTGLQRMVEITAAVLRQKQFDEVTPGMIESLASGKIVPRFAPVMPRDHQAAVDEVVKLSSTEPPQISTETAQDVLGRGPEEVKRLKEIQAEREAAKEKMFARSEAQNNNENQSEQERD